MILLSVFFQLHVFELSVAGEKSPAGIKVLKKIDVTVPRLSFPSFIPSRTEQVVLFISQLSPLTSEPGRNNDAACY